MSKPVAKASETAKIGVGIPEWCLYVYVETPTTEEIAAATRFIAEHPDIARIDTIIMDATFALVARGSDSKRIFPDGQIQMLSKRQRDVIERVVNNYLQITKPVLDAIKLILKKEKANDAN